MVVIHLLNSVYSETHLRCSWFSSFLTKNDSMKKHQNSTTYSWSASLMRLECYKFQ